jgi:hypothetical protein
MANTITIDIVAETRKLTEGVNEVGNQLGSIDSKLKGVASAAAAAASAFVLKQGVSFLKDGIEEAKEAKLVLQEATTTFGEGSLALQKITEDAEKFGKEIAVDNDEIIKLSVQLGSRLPADSKALSAELVNLAFDIEAFTGGAISAETVAAKLGKAFADGQVKASELEKIVPGLSAAIYDQAEALSAAGKNQEALTLLINTAQKKYGDAAEKNVTATQKFDVALANLKETVGQKILPFVEKLVEGLTKLIDKFSNLPGPVQNVLLGLLALVGIGGPLLGFLASAKTSLITLGLVSTTTSGSIGLATVATNLFSLALKAIPILAIVALIVLLVQNWDTVVDVVKKVVSTIKEFLPGAWQAVKDFANKVIGFVKDIIDIYLSLPAKMLNIGKDIVSGLWNGIQSMASWLKNRIFDFFGNLVPSWAKKMLGIGSPSKLFANFGEEIVAGLALGINTAKQMAEKATISLGAATVNGIGTTRISNAAMSGMSAPINVTINAGLGTDPYTLGRELQSVLDKYKRINTRTS